MWSAWEYQVSSVWQRLSWRDRATTHQPLRLATVATQHPRSRARAKWPWALPASCWQVCGSSRVWGFAPEPWNTHTHTLKLFYMALKERMYVMLDGKANELVNFGAVWGRQFVDLSLGHTQLMLANLHWKRMKKNIGENDEKTEPSFESARNNFATLELARSYKIHFQHSLVKYICVLTYFHRKRNPWQKFVFVNTGYTDSFSTIHINVSAGNS